MHFRHLVLLLAVSATVFAQDPVPANPPGFARLRLPVQVSIETGAPPFSQVDAEGRPVGFCIELLQAVADAENLSLRFDLRPWDEVLEEFRAGRVQLLGNVAYSGERDAFMDFSLPNFTMRGGFFVRRDGPALRTEADLKGRRIAVLRESLGHDFARSEETRWGAELLPVGSHDEAVAALRAGRCDAFLAMVLVTQQYLREQQVGDVVPAELTLDRLNYRLHFAVRPGDADLLRRINDGLLAVHRSGAYDRIYEKWLGPLQPRRLRLRDLRPYAVPALAVTGLVAAAFVWQRRGYLRAARHAEALRRSEERLQLVFEATEDGFWDWDVARDHVERSDQLARMIGYEPGELPPHARSLIELMHPDDAPRISALIADLVAGRIDHFAEECRLRTKSGDWRWILDRGKAVARDAAGRATRVAGTHTDITATKTAAAEAERLRQKMLDAQKLESLGVLAGGIAHDFNNLLTVVLGNTSLNQLDPATSPESAARLEKIHTAASRAADLCRQLLAYAGRGSFAVERVNLNELVHETTRLLEVTISRRAALQFDLAPELPFVEADPSQLRQVLMNLVINAAEAMPGGADDCIRVATSARRLQPGEPAQALPAGGVRAGEYVCVEVTDNGAGMTPEVLARIFDPFFTTKFTGRGLGLAAVLGIVRSHHGALQVQSQPNQGSTFRIYLPVAPVAAALA